MATKDQIKTVFSEHFMLSFWAFLAVFSFALPRVGHCVPWLLLRPLPRLQGSSGGRKGKVKSGWSLVVYSLHLCSASIAQRSSTASMPYFFFIFNNIGSVSFRVLLLNLRGQGEGPCFWVKVREREGIFYFLCFDGGCCRGTAEAGESGRREKFYKARWQFWRTTNYWNKC